jgi:outer membrane autotransporter protein
MICALGGPAVAQQCDPAAPAAGGTVTCSGGFIGTGYTAPLNTGITINVVPGTTLAGTVDVQGTGNTVVNNEGTLQGGPALNFVGVSGFTKTLNNTGTLNGGIVGSGDGTIIINQNGTFNSGGITITGAGVNTLNVFEGRNVNGLVDMTGYQNTINNLGTLNAGATLTGTLQNRFINGSEAGGRGTVSGTFTLTGPSNFVDNFGTFNGAVTLTGNGSNTIVNRPGAVMQSIDTTGGTSNDVVDNLGTVNVSILLGAGNDILTNRPFGTSTNPVENGTIDMGAGKDIFVMLGGTVNAPILMGPDNDQAFIVDGHISTNFQAQAGADRLTWSGGTISGFVDMGTEDDYALFLNLTPTNLATGLRIDGGLGSDQLVWDNTRGDGVYRYVNWELFQLTNGSQLTFDNYATLTLGDSVTGTGRLTIDATSIVFAGNGTHTVAPFSSRLLTTVENAGTIDLTNAGSSVTDAFVIQGNYIGQGGRLLLNTVLAGDGAPSDKLVIQSGAASGTTSLGITNTGGAGDITTGNGILVVEATNGGTTVPGAFSLSGRVAAGAFEYQLYRGGVTAGSEENWYLRNFIPSGICPVSSADCDTLIVVPPTVDPGGGGSGDGSGGGGGGSGGSGSGSGSGGGTAGVILFRPEVALQSALPSLARGAARATLGTFHDREGEQVYASADGVPRLGWARSYASHHEEAWRGTASPKFDGSYWGLQAGLPLYGIDHANGQRDRFGLFFGYHNTSGDVKGFSIGRRNRPVGKIDIDSYSVGAYWTHFWNGGAYLDAVAMGSWLDQNTRSVYGVKGDSRGAILTASLEAGYPIALSANWRLEPQAQLIFQHQQGDRYRDLFSGISYDSANVLTGRLGARLVGDLDWNGVPVKPFLVANLWHDFGNGSDTVRFNGYPIRTDRNATALEIGAGLSAQVTKNVALYGKANYTTELSGQEVRSIGGKLGVRLTW